RRSGCGAGGDQSEPRSVAARAACGPCHHASAADGAPQALVAGIAAAAGLEQLALAAVDARTDAHARAVGAGGAHEAARLAVAVDLVLALPARAASCARLRLASPGSPSWHSASFPRCHQSSLRGLLYMRHIY